MLRQSHGWLFPGPLGGRSGTDRGRALGEEIARAAGRIVGIGDGPRGRTGRRRSSVVGGVEHRLLRAREVMLGQAAVAAHVRPAAGALVTVVAVLGPAAAVGAIGLTVAAAARLTDTASAGVLPGTVGIRAVGVDQKQPIHDRAAGRRDGEGSGHGKAEQRNSGGRAVHGNTPGGRI